MMRELRQAARSLLRTPIFAATTVLILMLAVGANTAVFNLLYALVLRPLPVPDASELVQVSTSDRTGRVADLTWGQFRGLLEHQRAFSSVMGWIGQGVVSVDTGSGVVQAAVTGVTGNYYAELGARPALGRLIDGSDLSLEAARGDPVVVIGWRFWQQQYGGDPDVLGRTLRAEGIPLTIIGVAPVGFHGLGITIESDVSVPLMLIPRLFGSDDGFEGTVRWVGTTGRLAPGVSLESAEAQLAALWPRLQEAAMPPGLTGALREAYLDVRLQVASAERGVERGLRRRFATALYTLLAIAVLVLLIAGVNLCALVVARVEARRQELGVRLALGAGRWRVMRELTLEGILVGVAGAAGGLMFAAPASRAIAALLLEDYLVPASLDVSPGGATIAVAAVAAVGVGLVVTLVAGWTVTRSGLAHVTPGGSRSVARSSLAGKVLVGVQAALSMVLLVHASLLGQNVYNITAVDSGITSDTVLVGYPSSHEQSYRELDADTYYRLALDRVKGVAGVASAAFSQFKPGGGARRLEPVGIAGTPRGEGDVMAEASQVSPGFFETLGISVIRGRDFTFSDNSGNPKVAVISRQLSRQLFGDGPGIGQRVRISALPDWQNVLVVGTVSDARVYDVRGGNLAIAYVPSLQSGESAHYKALVVRAPSSASPEIRHTIESLGAEVMPPMKTLAYTRGRTIMQERMMAAAGGYFGLLALVLVAAGLFGLLSYVLSLRRKEIGIRMALGADARRMGGAILGDGLRVACLGLVAGLAGALLSVRLLERVLVATTPYDPVAIAGSCAVLLAVALAASAVPALRAAHVEPLAELRRE